MHQRKEEQTEKAIAFGLAGGVGSIIVGFLCVPAGFVIGISAVIALGFLLIILGIVSIAVALASGLGKTKKQFDGPLTIYPNVKVLSRSAYDGEARMVTADWELEQDDVRFYVKLELERGNRIEFECAREMFYQCGEGSKGEASVRGKWLGKFTAYIGPHPTSE